MCAVVFTVGEIDNALNDYILKNTNDSLLPFCSPVIK
ncbi:hypothetical protein C874_05290 [Elizabethkingia anophelis 502]|nr:hypothetical protein C874_05290 [Elizabethkingia anophelis 502]